MSIGQTPLPQQRDSAPVTLWVLFATFVEITLSAFGGAMAWAYRILVEKRRWYNAREFAELWSFAQAMPGANIVNAAIFVGMRYQGARGAAVAFVALLMVPLLIVLPMAALYSHVGQIELVRAVLRGIATVAAGLLVSMGIKMALPLRRDPWALAVAALAFVGVGLLRWPLLLVLVILTPCSIALAWWRQR